MNTLSPDITRTFVGLNVEIRSADGTSTEFYQNDEECVRKTLRVLTSPRSLAQTQLVLPAKQGANTIRCASIDIILAHTLARAPLIFPLIFPAGLLDLVEVQNECWACDRSRDAHQTGDAAAHLSPLLSYLEIRTSGGWSVALRALSTARDSAYAERPLPEEIRKLPLIPFRLWNGGIGVINPRNVRSVSTRPVPCATPGLASPTDLFRRNPYRF